MRTIMKHCSAQQQQQLRSKFMQAIYKIMMNFDQPSRLSITAYVLITASHHIRRISRWLKVSSCVVTMQQSQLSLPKLKLKWNKGWRAERMVKPMGGWADGWMNEWFIAKLPFLEVCRKAYKIPRFTQFSVQFLSKNVHLLCPRDGVWVVGRSVVGFFRFPNIGCGWCNSQHVNSGTLQNHLQKVIEKLEWIYIAQWVILIANYITENKNWWMGRKQ